MKQAAIVGVLAFVVTACGGGSTKSISVTRSPDTLGVRVHSPATAREREQVLAGDTIASQAGCLACHVIARQGNSGPGPDLTRVGARLTKAQLVHVLRSPQPPMPSFRWLGAARLTDLVEFLHALR